MSDIRESVVELIGKTPMLRLHRYEMRKRHRLSSTPSWST